MPIYNVSALNINILCGEMFINTYSESVKVRTKDSCLFISMHYDVRIVKEYPK